MPPVARDREIDDARQAMRALRESKNSYVKQPAPEGLLPPRTAPDTPNVTRQYIENSEILNDQAKRRALQAETTTRYIQDPPAGGWFEGSWPRKRAEGLYRAFSPGYGKITSFYDDPTAFTAQHEAIHANQWDPTGSDFGYPYTESGRTIADDTRRLADEGYRWAQETVDILDNPEHDTYGSNTPEGDALEYQAFSAGGDPNPAEVPPWFRQKHFSNIWSDEAMNAEAPPLPDDRTQFINPVSAAWMNPSPPRHPYLDERMSALAGFKQWADRVMDDPMVDYMSRQMRPSSPDDAVYKRMESDPRRWSVLRWKSGNYPHLEDPDAYQGPPTREEYFRQLKQNDVRHNDLIFGYG